MTIVKGEHIPGYDSPNACFVNVAKLVRDKGGKAVMCWLVNSCEDYTSKVHHCVWQKPSGELVDVSPQFDADISKSEGQPTAALMRSVEVELDPSATLVNGLTRPIKVSATKLRHRKWVSLLNVAEQAFFNGNIKEANRWTELADRGRAKAHGEKYSRQTIHRFAEGSAVGKPLRSELIPYLPA